jgi:hypothetical protein
MLALALFFRALVVVVIALLYDRDRGMACGGARSGVLARRPPALRRSTAHPVLGLYQYQRY